MSAAACTIVDTGGCSPNTAPWARPISSARLMSVTNIRVRTTCSMRAQASAPARTSARARRPTVTQIADPQRRVVLMAIAFLGIKLVIGC